MKKIFVCPQVGNKFLCTQMTQIIKIDADEKIPPVQRLVGNLEKLGIYFAPPMLKCVDGAE